MMSDSQKSRAMIEGGKHLGHIKHALHDFTQIGTTFEDVEAEAQRLIKAAGATPSFSTVPGYHWATCIMKNDAMLHGIPEGQVVNDGDVITIDVGLVFEGYHLDTSITFAVGEVSPEINRFLEVGQRSLAKAIAQAKLGNTVYEISYAMQKVVEGAGYSCAYQLTGHGVGKKLHEEPAIPCIAQRRDKRVELKDGMTLAIEIMYAMGDATLVTDADGWTYRTKDGSLSGMFEETVLVSAEGPKILTAAN